MKKIFTSNYLKKAKSKYPKKETEPYNPWAVCTKSVGREDKDKYERCVKQIKKQNREKNSSIIEAKKNWIQDAVKKPGSFTEYCGGKVTDECIQRGKNSPYKKTKQRAELAETFRGMKKKKD